MAAETPASGRTDAETPASGRTDAPPPELVDEARKAAYAVGLGAVRLALEEILETGQTDPRRRAALMEQAVKFEPLLGEKVGLEINLRTPSGAARKLLGRFIVADEDYNLAAQKEAAIALCGYGEGSPLDETAVETLRGGFAKQMSLLIYMGRAAFQMFAGGCPELLREALGPDPPADLRERVLAGVFAVDPAQATLLIGARHIGMEFVLGETP